MPTLAEARSQRAALIRSLHYAIECSDWTVGYDADGVTVAHARPVYAAGQAPHRVEGFLISAELDDVSVDHGLAYFHDACHFADTANAMTSASEIVDVQARQMDRYEALVRTGFALPWPLQDREFLHYVTTHRAPDTQARDAATIAYASVDSGPGVPAPWPGALRCPMQPSGQLITDLGRGRIRLQHCMTYDLVGSIPTWAQNLMFHRGHVDAYVTEWAAAMDVLRVEAREPAHTKTRGALSARRTA